MNTDIEKSWEIALSEYFKTSSFLDLVKFVKDEYKTFIVYPQQKDIFNAFNLTPLDKVKVVIIGQDPYHNPDQAHGLCFSVKENIKPPPSLRNIYKEIATDIGVDKDITDGFLENWAKQGVLLINSVLTVRKKTPGSHVKKGWEGFTDEVIKQISDNTNNVVFLLWGNYAKKKGLIVDRNKHLVLEAAHPSPFSAYNGFFGCKHFSETNKYLKSKGFDEIVW